MKAKIWHIQISLKKSHSLFICQPQSLEILYLIVPFSSFMSFVSFRLLELHSPDGQHTVVLRCKDGPSANSWFTAIHTNIAALLPQTLAHISAYLGASSSASTHPHLKHIGWLAEQVFLALFSFTSCVLSYTGDKPFQFLRAYC